MQKGLSRHGSDLAVAEEAAQRRPAQEAVEGVGVVSGLSVETCATAGAGEEYRPLRLPLAETFPGRCCAKSPGTVRVCAGFDSRDPHLLRTRLFHQATSSRLLDDIGPGKLMD